MEDETKRYKKKLTHTKVSNAANEPKKKRTQKQNKTKKTKRIQKQKHKTTRKNSRTSHNLYSPMSLCDS